MSHRWKRIVQRGWHYQFKSKPDTLSKPESFALSLNAQSKRFHTVIKLQIYQVFEIKRNLLAVWTDNITS